MRPLSLAVRAFRGFRAPFTLPLDGQGILLVEGENHDAPDAFASNGAGKSLAVVEAPMWALFDRTVRYGERAVTAEVAHPERGADVAFRFQMGPHVYEATRSRSPKGSPRFTLTQDGTPYPLSKDPGTARREMAEVLGFDYVAFRHAVVVQGGDSLASAGFAAQMGVLEMILRTYTLAKAAERAAQAALGAERDLAGAQGTVRACDEALRRATLAVRAAESAIRDLPDSNDIVEELKQAKGLSAYAEETRRTELLAAQQVTVSREAYAAAGQALHDTLMASDRVMTETARKIVEARGLLMNRACTLCKRPFEGARDTASIQQALAEAEAVHQQADTVHTPLVAAARAHERRSAEAVQTAERLLTKAQERLRVAEAAQHRAEVLQVQLDGMEQARQVAEAAYDRAGITEAEARQALEAAQAEVQVAQGQVAIYRFWAKGFSRTDLQADLVASATPVLNAAAARHAQSLTAGQILVTFDPFRASTREDLVRIAGASAPTYAGLSRGEKERVDLIIALSLRDLARWRLPEPVQFAVYDEVFDHCDAVGLRVIAAMLQADAARGATVVVVTHNPTFKSYFPGAKIVRVIKRGGEADVRVTTE